MKCTEKIKTGTKGKQVIIVKQHKEQVALDRKWTLSKRWRPCNGEIKAEISLTTEFEYYGADGEEVLDIEYVCQKCRTRVNLQDWPTDLDSLRDYLNNKLGIYG